MIYLKPFTFPQGCAGKGKHEAEHEAGLKLLREALKLEYGLQVDDISTLIQKGEHGKPRLEGFPEISFNISHGGNMAACALGRKALGVDVEFVRQVKETVIRRVLTKGEQAYLSRCPAKCRDREFFRFWTLKESYGKALGVGLALDFSSVEFTLGQPWMLGEGEEGLTVRLGGNGGRSVPYRKSKPAFRILGQAEEGIRGCLLESGEGGCGLESGEGGCGLESGEGGCGLESGEGGGGCGRKSEKGGAPDWQFLQFMFGDGRGGQMDGLVVSFCGLELPEEPYLRIDAG